MDQVSGLLASSTGGAIAEIFLFEIALYVIVSIGAYGFFKKAGQPGWAAFVPIYNAYIVLKIIGRPGWWLLLFFLGVIPFFGSLAVLVLAAIICNDLAKSFGKGTGFAVGLFFLGFIFSYILSYGSAQYLGPAAAGGGTFGSGPQQFGAGGYAPPPSGGYAPPPSGGYAPPPSGGYAPPPYAPPPSGGYAPPPYAPPPSGGYAPPPYAPPPAPPPAGGYEQPPPYAPPPSGQDQPPAGEA
ncbi:MAG: DUF5684 domain-containing protein [Acidimicrobiales bacterium]